MTLPVYSMNDANFPEMYERHLVGPLFRPWAEELLERAALAPSDRVLDVACGTGIVARLAKARLGPASTVVGVDVSAPMIAVASEQDRTVDWRVGDAAALPVGDSERFDVVLCQQGMQFFTDREAAAREMRRVLAPRGRALVSTWRPIEENPFYFDMQRVAERYVGPFEDQRHSFGDGAALGKLLEAAGFSGVQVTTVARIQTFDDPAAFLRMNTMAIVGMSGAAADQSGHDRARLTDIIARESEPVLARYVAAGKLSFAATTNVAVGHAVA